MRNNETVQSGRIGDSCLKGRVCWTIFGKEYLELEGRMLVIEVEVSLVGCNKTIMSYLEQNYEIIGRALAIAGLALAPLTSFFARHYSRSLYFAQMLTIWGLVFLTSLKNTVSINLVYSWLTFMPEFTSKWCTAGDYSCMYGTLLSPGIVWLGGAFFFLLLIKIIGCKKREAKFLSFYNFYKGLLYWFLGPLIYYSTIYVVAAIQSGSIGISNKDFLAAVIVLAIFFVITIVEIIAYKVAQREEQNVWRKWIQFFSHYMVAGVFVFTALKSTSNDVLKYIVIVFLALFFIIYLIKYKFTLKVLERIIVFIQDGIIIAVFIIFTQDYNIIADKAIDFYALCVVIVLEVIQLLIKIVYRCKNGAEDDEEAVVSPEKEGRDFSNKKVNNSFANEQINPQGSYDGLKNSSGIINPASPKRSPPKRR